MTKLIRNIVSIEVKKIFGEFDYVVDLKDDIKIIIGPNGTGKTTFFKIINSIISKRHIELYEYEFDSATIVFSDGELKIEKNVVDVSDDSIERFKNLNYSEDDEIQEGNSIKYYINGNYAGTLEKTHLPTLSFFSRSIPQLVRSRDYLYDLQTNEVFTEADKFTIIEKYSSYLSDDILIVPDKVADLLSGHKVTSIFTDRLQDKNIYRSDRSNQVYEHSSIEKCAMQIKSKMNDITSRYAEFSQKVDQEFPIKIVEVLEKENSKNGSEEIQVLSEHVKDMRIRLINSGLFDINDETYIDNKFDEMGNQTLLVLKEYYNNMINKMTFLIPLSNKIELLLELFNGKILSSGKKCYINYKDGIYIKNKKGKKIPFEKLSSGEQHEFVQHYILIFEVDEGDIVLIDEPEISIHVSWQRHYIEDLKKIMKDRKGIKVIIATHSAQIVNNNWDFVLDIGEVEV